MEYVSVDYYEKIKKIKNARKLVIFSYIVGQDRFKKYTT